MQPGLTISVFDSDADSVDVEVSASNGRFAGSIRRISLARGDIANFAGQLASFPTSIDACREAELGYRTSRDPGGLLRIVARTISGFRGGVLELEVTDLDEFASGARFTLQIEAASVDAFVDALRDIETNREGSAYLPASS